MDSDVFVDGLLAMKQAIADGLDCEFAIKIKGPKSFAEAIKRAEKAEAEVIQLQTRLAAKDKDLDLASAEISELHADLECSRESRDRNAVWVKEADAKISQLKAKIEKLEAEIKEKDNRWSDLLTSTALDQAERQKANDEIATSQIRVAQLEQDLLFSKKQSLVDLAEQKQITARIASERACEEIEHHKTRAALDAAWNIIRGLTGNSEKK